MKPDNPPPAKPEIVSDTAFEKNPPPKPMPPKTKPAPEKPAK